MRVRLGNLVTSPQDLDRHVSQILCPYSCEFTLRWLGLAENFTIYDMGDSKKVVKQAIENTEVDLRTILARFA